MTGRTGPGGGERARLETIVVRSRRLTSRDNERRMDVWVRESSAPCPSDFYFSLVKGRNAHLIVRQNGDLDAVPSGRSRTGMWYRHLRHLLGMRVWADGEPVAPRFRKQVRGLGYLYRAFDGLERIDVAPTKKGGIALWFLASQPRKLEVEFHLGHDPMWPITPTVREYRGRSVKGGYEVESDLTRTRLEVESPTAHPVRLEGDRWRVRIDRMRRARIYLSADGSEWAPPDLADTLDEQARSFDRGPILETPSFRLNKLFLWAQHDLDELFSDSVIGSGWFAGLPVFSWFFGRDGEWTSFAALATGRADQAAAHLATLYRYRDGGRMPHELVLVPAPTEGSDPASARPLPTDTQYMSIDTNPLWALGQLRLARWTGRPVDVAAVTEALDFSRGLDVDGDGLIENNFKRRLIGWTESWAHERDGKCIDANAWWLAAISEYAAATGVDRYNARKVRERFQSTFFPRDAAGRLQVLDSVDGPIQRRTRTPAQIVPAIYESDPILKEALALVATPDLVGPWGVHALSLADPKYDGGYHTGAVWPLMTGWFVLAAYRQGLPLAAFEQLLSFPTLAFASPDPGRVSETYHPEFAEPTGQFVQAWSSALFISSVVEGLFGVEPTGAPGVDGIRRGLTPHLPLAWPEMSLKRLPYQGQRYSIAVGRDVVRVSQ